MTAKERMVYIYPHKQCPAYCVVMMLFPSQLTRLVSSHLMRTLLRATGWSLGEPSRATTSDQE